MKTASILLHFLLALASTSADKEGPTDLMDSMARGLELFEANSRALDDCSSQCIEGDEPACHACIAEVRKSPTNGPKGTLTVTATAIKTATKNCLACGMFLSKSLGGTIKKCAAKNKKWEATLPCVVQAINTVTCRSCACNLAAKLDKKIAALCK